MLKLKDILTEAFCPDKEEFEKAAQRSEYKIVEVWMDKNGVIAIDDYTNIPPTKPDDFKNRKSTLRLNYNANEVVIYHTSLHGNKIASGTQQLLAALVKKGVIDSSWKVSFHDTEGYYLGGSYVTRPGEFEGLPLNFWKRNKRVDLGENLVLYHGTDTKALPKILKYGLRPLGMEGVERGYESRLKVEYNKNFIYLSGTFQGAFLYAKNKARWDMMQTDKSQYDYVQHWEWERWFIKPVILLVTLPDFTKLRSDDDRVIGMIKEKGYELWAAMSPEQREAESEKSSKWYKDRGVNYGPEKIEAYQWVTSDNGFKIVLNHINQDEWKDWKSSLGSHNQVAYAGVIPPQYIKVLDLEKVIRKPRRQ